MLVNPFSQTVAQAMLEQHVDLILAAEIAFESGMVRVHTGTGNVVIAGSVYLGIGYLGQVDAVKEQNTTSSTQLNLTLAGLESGMVGTVLNENCVGKLATLYIGTLDTDFNLVSADVAFRGKIRNSTLIAGENSAVNLTVANIFEEWSQSKPLRFTDECQQRYHDGDRIFRYTAQMSDRSIFWGSKKDAPTFRYK